MRIRRAVLVGVLLLVVAVPLVVARGRSNVVDAQVGALVVDSGAHASKVAVRLRTQPVPPAAPPVPPVLLLWPGAANTGVPDGLVLHGCSSRITVSGTYDACHFQGDVVIAANNVIITRSLINGSVDAGSGFAGQQVGLVITDSTIDCGCLSLDDATTPTAILESNFTLRRVEVLHSGHGVAVKSNVVIEDSWIHDLGGNTAAHKDGVFSGDGTNVVIRHNTIDCNDGPKAGCTSAIGLLTDFGPITHYTIDNNLLNTNGSYCLYASGGPQKPFRSSNITVTNNHFGRKYSPNCGFFGPVTYFDSTQPGMVWQGNVWDDTGQPIQPQN